MELIINISEEEVNECKRQVDMIKQEGFLIESLNTALKIHVANGTPLPKGHGNLIQREEAETIFRNARMALYKQSRTERIKDLQTRESMLLNAEQFVHLIKPIIEADKAESEDKE